MSNAYKILVGKCEGKRSHRKHRPSRMCSRKCEYEDGIHLAQDRDQWRVLENNVMYLGVKCSLRSKIVQAKPCGVLNAS
jgi:hypothetical protein